MNKPVFAADGARIGRVKEATASPGKFPRLSAVAVRLNKTGRERLASSDKTVFVAFDAAEEASGIRLRTITPVSDPQEDIHLRRDILDRQIVDIDGARVVRVNDLLLSQSSNGVSVVGAEVGLLGVLRGLGLERPSEKLAGALGFRIPTQLIPWNYVAPIGPGPQEVQLAVPNRLLKELHPSELADILDQLDPELRTKTIHMMSAANLAETLPEAQPELSRQAMDLLTEERARQVMELMPPDEAADVLGSLDYGKSQRLLGLMGIRQAAVLRELLGYPPESAGGRMTPSFVGIPATLTAAEAIERIREEASSAEAIYYAYVLDEKGRLQGVLSLRTLLRSGPRRMVSELMETDLVAVRPTEHQEKVAHLMARYNLLALPVTDDMGVVKGIVTVDDMVDVLEEEASENLGEITGVFLGEGDSVAASRLISFGVSIAGGAIAAVMLEARRPVLASIAALAWLLPLFLRISQDLGTWSLARAFVTAGLGRARRLDAYASELLAGVTLSALAGILVWIFSGLWTDSPEDAAVLGVGIFVGTLSASLIGLAVPALIRHLRLGPLVARGRLLAVGVGLASLLVYFWALSSLGARL
ncbi:MAG: magnesium transporter [Actinomycetota bacterium]